MKINMYNVGFGDCFVFEENKNSLIIDFGTKYGKDNKKIDLYKIASDIMKDYIDNKECDALITHFHEDHIKGFEYLRNIKKNIFNRVYLPHIIGKNKNNIILASEIIYLYLFLPEITKGFIMAKNMLDHIELVCELVKDYSGIEVLYTDKNFKFSKTECLVIWPDKGINLNRRNITNIQSIIGKLQEIFNEVIDVNLVKRLDNNLTKWYEVIEFESKRYINLNNEIQNILNEQQKIIIELNKIREKFQITGKSLYCKFINEIGLLTKDLGRTMNENSIVFHNKDKGKLNDDLILMMGDVTTRVIDKFLYKKFYQDMYRYIKVPHHGTKSNYSTKIPKAKTLLISTGKYGNYGKISTKYQEHCCRKNGERYCTSGYSGRAHSNNHCEGAEKGNFCNFTNCNTSKRIKYQI